MAAVPTLHFLLRDVDSGYTTPTIIIDMYTVCIP